MVLLCVLGAGTFTVAETGLGAYFDVGLRARSAELEEKKFSAPRDVLTVLKGPTDGPAFFDFPNTLLTLKPVVEFKLSMARNADPSAAQRELATRGGVTPPG